MKVAYVTTYDAADVRNWSGIGHNLAKALDQRGLEILPIGPLKKDITLPILAKKLYYRYLRRQEYFADRAPQVLHSYARQAAQKLAQLDYDVVLSPASIPVSYLKTEKPIVFWTDATFAGMTGFYPGWMRLCKETIANGNMMEHAALTNCRLAIYSSEWAAKSALDHYRVDAAKIKVVPFGANIECSRSAADIRILLEQRRKATCELLFLGVNWQRKGGDIAIQVAQELNRRGITTRLVVAGCDPPGALPDFVAARGFISKSTPEGRAALDRMFTEAHFLILPTRADCAPVVIAEANSFGLPVVASNVGGIPNILKDQRNGAALALDNFIETAAGFIQETFTDLSQYEKLSLGSFNTYAHELNWQTATGQVEKLLKEITH